MAAYECGQRIAELVPCAITPDGIILGVLLIHLFGSGVSVEDGAQDRRWAGAYCAVVQINLACGNQELLAQFCPVSILVLVEERAIGQRGRRVRKLSRQIPTEGDRCRQSSGAGSEEVAAVQHVTSCANKITFLAQIGFLGSKEFSGCPRIKPIDKKDGQQ